MNMRYLRVSALVALILLVFTGCDMGSYNNIARSLDPFTPMGPNAKGWFLGSGNPGSSTAKVLVLSEADDGIDIGESGTFLYLKVQDIAGSGMDVSHTDLILQRGQYLATATKLTLIPLTKVTGAYQETSSPADFITTDLGLLDQILDYSVAGDFLTIEGNTGDDVYESIDSIIGKITGNLTGILTFYQLSVYTSQAAIPGFGGTGMMKYTSATPFNGIVSGSVTVEMPVLLPDAEVNFDYADQVNFPGVTKNGILSTISNARGNGRMAGVVEADLNGTVVNIHYDEIELKGTIPSAGSYYVDLTPLTPPDGGDAVDSQTVIPGTLDYFALH